MTIAELREAYHRRVCREIIRISEREIKKKRVTYPIVAVTSEPLPTRLAALALGTGDLDCVYHFALYELKEAIAEIENEDQMDMLNTLLDGRRLRDISDLPFDLAI